MNRSLSFLLLLLLVAGAPSLSSCGSDGEEEKLHVTGTVLYVDLEGGFFGIVAEDGKQYEPVNLPDEFQLDGSPVEVKAIPKRDAVGIHQWGRIIVIEEIARR